MHEFPGWDGRIEFVAAFRDAVRTRRRLTKRLPKHPPVVLRTGSAENSLKALQALEEGLLRSKSLGGLVPCVPYAFIEGRDGGTRTQLIEEIAETLRKNTPAEMGRLRLPTYDLVHSVTDDGTTPTAADVYARLRRRRTELSGESRNITVTAGPLSVPLESVLKAVHTVRRKCWEWRWQLRLGFSRRYRPLWPDDYRLERTLDSALERFAGERGAGADAWDGLLLTALMIDLYGQARQGLLHPGRRRRRTRHALLLNGSTGGADAVSGFVSLYDEKVRVCPNPAVVMVAALPQEPDSEPGSPTLAEAAGKLAEARREALGSVQVTLPEPGGVTVQVRPVWKPWLRIRPGKELFLEITTLSVAAWMFGLGAFLGFAGPLDEYDTCLDAPRYVSQTRPAHETTDAQYREAIEEIDRLSREAEKQGDPDRTVTIALVHSTPPKNNVELRFGGLIPELRGVALALKSLNASAPNDDHGVSVRIKRYEAGVQYKNAERKAKEIIEDAKKDPRFVGVTGFTESRTRTVAALRLLDKQGIPIVTNTATAKRMEVGRSYHGVAPNNEREANVVASFLEKANTVRTGENSCAPPDHIAIVTDPQDVYSDELGLRFAAEEKAAEVGKRIGYTPGSYNPQDVSTESGLEMAFSMREVASAVCGRVKKESRTLVYWTSRVREFESFLSEYQNTDCANEALTVVGGNELTNAALSSGYADKPWLRLYHTTHTLPIGDPDRNSNAVAFNRAYTAAYGKTDLWVNDGHAPLSHDAVKVFSESAKQALEAGAKLNLSNVHQYILNRNFKMEGASGHIDFTHGTLRPDNKMLTVLHHKQHKSGAVLVCGKPGNNISAGEHWRQGDETYDCPED